MQDKLPELYVATDVEADGPIPGPYSMLPFGMTGSGIDLRSYWMGMTGCQWVESRKGRIKHTLRLTELEHTHHAGDDAAELAKVFEAMLASRAR